MPLECVLFSPHVGLQQTVMQHKVKFFTLLTLAGD